MKLKNILRKAIFLLIFSPILSQNTFAQCFQIESILVDACEGAPNTEGLNEMVRFKVGAAVINTSNMSVNWPSNTWGGLVQNTITATKVASLNAAILAAGGCGEVLQPTGGVLPANATVVLVTSYDFDTAANSFGALTDTIYILFQNKNVTSGHFGNFGPSATRTLKIFFGTCSDTVTYNRSFLTDQNGQNAAGDGATVLFTPAGVASYINNGCVAPVSVFTVDANPASATTCAGNPVSLTGTAQGQQSVIWSAPSGTFSNPNSLSTTFTPSSASAGTTVTVTLTATNSCGAQISDTVNVTVSNALTPNFDVTPLNICTGSSVPTLNTTSPNGITGTWNPATISNTNSGTYTFTPNAGQCATSVSLSVTISNSITPNFDVTPLNICTGSSVPTLNTTSPNGITGTWNPATISNTNSGTYTFTPNAGQCATSVSLNVTVGSSIVPNFDVTPLNICTGSSVPTLSTTSSNGITGTWSPAVISNTASGTYTFTPNAGQCATSVSLNVTVGSSIVPNFNVTPLNICTGSSVPTLSTTSPNGITGTWNPATISNTNSGTYTFTPNAGQCATSVSLNVTISNSITPNFDVTPLNICTGSTVPTLSTTSPNGITGTWSPATISNTNSATYTFTPNAGQCATSVSLNVTVGSSITPNFNVTPLNICTGSSVTTLNTTSPNGITGTWNPATISNTNSGTYTFTPNAGQCAASVSLNVTISNSITPNFNVTPLNICTGSTVPTLNTTSPNGISGIWNPATISNTNSGTYTFTPNAGQCATSVSLSVTISNSITPNFNVTPLNICTGSTVPTLSTTSPNGISGTWNPAVISNTTSGTYTFTPNANQCATSVSLNVTISNSITPNFNVTPLNICTGSSVPTLSTTSPNGISGTWNPSVISNTASGTYTFTPNAGQCATSVSLNVTVGSSITPNFNVTPLNICTGSSVPTLNTTSPNGITGTWNPVTISNTNSGTYTFTPNANQCATSVSLNVTVTTLTNTPISGASEVCKNETIQLTNSTSGGVWSSTNTSIATVDSNGNVTGIASGNTIIKYTISNGSCSISETKTITVNALPNPILTDKFICINNQTGVPISNATLNSQVPDNGNYSFVWTLNNNTISNTTNTHQATVAGIYKVVVTNLTTGCTASASASVTVATNATATASVEQDFDRIQTITINVTGGSGSFEYQLENDPVQTSNQFTGIYSGEYQITVRDTNGCTELFLDVFAYNYPRYFSPNEDGYNDYWNIKSLSNQPDAQIYIFDRYGKLLKYLTPATAGWDGTYNGRQLPSTDYWFKVIYKGRTGNEKEFKAHFAMKR